MALARQLGADLEVGRALLALGGAQADSGSFEAAVVPLREACRLAEQHADLDTLGHAWGWLGDTLIQAGRPRTRSRCRSGRRAAAAPRTRRPMAGHLPDGPRGQGAVQARPLGRRARAGDTGLGAAQPEEGEAYAFWMVAGLELARGELQAAEAHLETIKERVPVPGRHTIARPPARSAHGRAAGLARPAGGGPSGGPRRAGPGGRDRRAMRSGLLLCLGMRVEADQAELGRARHDQGEVQAAVRSADALASRAEAMAPNPLVAGASPVLTTPAVAALFDAERTRLDGRSDPVQWQKAAAAWSALWPALPGRLRPVAAGRGVAGQPGVPGQGRETLRAAHTVAVRLGAAPLRRELELLAQRGRVRLEATGRPAAASRRRLRWLPRWG